MNTALSRYRVLDLTEGGCMIGGKILGDLGADVIKVEPLGGSQSRIAPFYKGIIDPEKSLYWFAYNMNKRGITLDISKADGKEIFMKLVETADVVMESFSPGYMDGLGLGYADLAKLKQNIIMTSITQFGLRGPKAGYKGSDLITWASGGFLNICGDPDRPPVWVSFPQASLHAGAEAAVGTLVALWYRQQTGEGQQVDVSIQECVVHIDFNIPEFWDLNKINFTRFSKGLNVGTKGVKMTHVWKCNDGYVQLILQGGSEPFLGSSQRLVQWMGEEGMADNWLNNIDWANDYNASKVNQDLVDKVEDAVQRFLLTKTKNELYEEGGLGRRILIAPNANIRDVWENKQVRERDFWVKVLHDELGESLTYCGPFVRLSESPVKYGRAPLIGEHNVEVYEKEMRLSKEKLSLLKKALVI